MQVVARERARATSSRLHNSLAKRVSDAWRVSLKITVMTSSDASVSGCCGVPAGGAAASCRRSAARLAKPIAASSSSRRPHSDRCSAPTDQPVSVSAAG